MAKRKNSRKPNVCKLCGSEFPHRDRRQSYCSSECLEQIRVRTGLKNRVYKTCTCGFVGFGVAQFPIDANGSCASCWDREKKDEWNKWSKHECNRFFHHQRRLERTKTLPWDRWATQKSTILSMRSRVVSSQKNHINSVSVDNWECCIKIGLQRLFQQARDKEMDRWTRKCCSWSRSLKTRERMQEGKRSGV